MTKKEMADDRFHTKAEEFKVIHRPQCLGCEKNINRMECKEFKNKPKDYMANIVDCPLRINRKREG